MKVLINFMHEKCNGFQVLKFSYRNRSARTNKTFLFVVSDRGTAQSCDPDSILSLRCNGVTETLTSWTWKAAWRSNCICYSMRKYNSRKCRIIRPSSSIDVNWEINFKRKIFLFPINWDKNLFFSRNRKDHNLCGQKLSSSYKSFSFEKWFIRIPRIHWYRNQ